MQLNTILSAKIILNSQKFCYWMWAKVRLIISSKRFGSGQCLAVRVPRQAILL